MNPKDLVVDQLVAAGVAREFAEKHVTNARFEGATIVYEIIPTEPVTRLCGTFGIAVALRRQDGRPLTEEELEEIRRRRAALPIVDLRAGRDFSGNWVVENQSGPPVRAIITSKDHQHAVADFFEHAPRDIDALLAEVELLRGMLDDTD